MQSQRNKALRSPLSMVKVISQEADCEQPEEAESLNSTRRPWHFLPLCCLYLVERRPRITKLKDPTTRPVWSPIFRSLNYRPSMAMQNKRERQSLPLCAALTIPRYLNYRYQQAHCAESPRSNPVAGSSHVEQDERDGGYGDHCRNGCPADAQRHLE